jgi:hypothetical protein
MTDPESRRKLVDDEHLRLLSIAYVISGIMTALVSLMGLLYAAWPAHEFFAAAAGRTHPRRCRRNRWYDRQRFGGFFPC